MAVHSVKIFLTDEAHAELQDRYLDKESELKSFVFEKIKALAMIAKTTKLQKSFQYNIEAPDEDNPKNRIRKTEIMDLKKIDLDKFSIKEDPSWIPEKFSKDDVSPYVYKVGDKTWDYLILFCKIFLARIDLFNKSILKDDPQRKLKLAIRPTCVEQILDEHLIVQLFNKVVEVAGNEFDEEDEEINKAAETKKSEKAEPIPEKPQKGFRKKK